MTERRIPGSVECTEHRNAVALGARERHVGEPKAFGEGLAMGKLVVLVGLQPLSPLVREPQDHASVRVVVVEDVAVSTF